MMVSYDVRQYTDDRQEAVVLFRCKDSVDIRLSQGHVSIG